MAFPRHVVKVSILGDCFNQGEEWSTGFWLAQLSGNSVLPGDCAQQVAAHWETFFKNATTSVSNKYRTVSIKANLFGTDGKQLTNPTQEYFYPVPLVGPNASAPMPPQLTVVASLRNEVPRGDATHGRMYLPGINAGVDADARLSGAIQNTIGTNLKNMIDGINGMTNGAGLRVVLASAKNSGTVRQVSKVMIGNLYDTQRRRRNGLTEGYTTHPVIMGGGSF
jgi:hypothetical protein